MCANIGGTQVSGCDADHYKPLNINGWFWASTLVKVPKRDFRNYNHDGHGNNDHDADDIDDDDDGNDDDDHGLDDDDDVSDASHQPSNRSQP